MSPVRSTKALSDFACFLWVFAALIGFGWLAWTYPAFLLMAPAMTLLFLALMHGGSDDR